jgi:hypothetical protein
MQGEQMANLLQQQQLQAILGGVTGSKDPLTGDFSGGLLSSIMDLFSDNSGAESSTAPIDLNTFNTSLDPYAGQAGNGGINSIEDYINNYGA